MGRLPPDVLDALDRRLRATDIPRRGGRQSVRRLVAIHLFKTIGFIWSSCAPEDKPANQCAGKHESQLPKRDERDAGWRHVRAREAALGGGRHQADGRTELAGRTSSKLVAPVAELMDHGDGDRDEQRGQNHQEYDDREEHGFSRILREADRWTVLSWGELVAEFVMRNLGAKPRPGDVPKRPTLADVLSPRDKQCRSGSGYC